jgi:hypothetical protein
LALYTVAVHITSITIWYTVNCPIFKTLFTTIVNTCGSTTNQWHNYKSCSKVKLPSAYILSSHSWWYHKPLSSSWRIHCQVYYDFCEKCRTFLFKCYHMQNSQPWLDQYDWFTDCITMLYQLQRLCSIRNDGNDRNCSNTLLKADLLLHSFVNWKEQPDLRGLYTCIHCGYESQKQLITGQNEWKLLLLKHTYAHLTLHLLYTLF